MNRDRGFPYRLYLVISETDCRGRELLWVAEEAIRGGVDLIQLREKQATTAEFLKKAIQLKNVTDHYGIPLIINDNLAVAQQVGAFGIHVGQQDLPPSEIRRAWRDCRLLGYSVEELSQLENPEVGWADYLGVSPIFSTDTKPDTVTEWGIDGIQNLRQQTDVPLVAIGRMGRDNAAAVIKAGADCMAVVSAICAADRPREAAAELKALVTSIPS